MSENMDMVQDFWPKIFRCPSFGFNLAEAACAVRQGTRECSGEPTFRPCGDGTCAAGLAVLVSLGPDVPEGRVLDRCAKHANRAHPEACTVCRRTEEERRAAIDAAAPIEFSAADGYRLTLR